MEGQPQTHVTAAARGIPHNGNDTPGQLFKQPDNCGLSPHIHPIHISHPEMLCFALSCSQVC